MHKNKCIYICTCARAYISKRVCIYVYIYVYVCTHTYVYVWAHRYKCISVTPRPMIQLRCENVPRNNALPLLRETHDLSMISNSVQSTLAIAMLFSGRGRHDASFSPDDASLNPLGSAFSGRRWRAILRGCLRRGRQFGILRRSMPNPPEMEQRA